MNEDEIILFLRRDDDKVRQELHEKYFQRLLFIAKYLTTDSQTALKIIDDAFIKMWEQNSKFTELNLLGAHLTFITIQSCKTFIEHRNEK